MRRAIAIALLLGGCASGAKVSPNRATLVVSCPVADAALWVDETHVGLVADLDAGVRLPAGRHRIECADGCGVEVGGYDDDVSYLFAGGLDLEQIVID